MKAGCARSLLFAVLILSFQQVIGAPVVTSVSPFVGPSSGGTTVSITGSGFAEATAVTFGTANAASFVINSDSSITAVTPVHPPLVVPVVVTAASGTSPQTHDTLFVFQGSSLAYVANYNSNTVTAINTTTNAVVATIGSADFNPRAAAILPDGTKVYVAYNGSSAVSVIDTSTNLTIATISVNNFPYALGITTDGIQAFVVNNNSGTVQAINTASDLVTATITVGSNPSAIAITPDGLKAYIANSDSNNVSVINTSTQLLVTNIPVDSFPVAIAITPDGAKAFVANNNSDDVSIIDTGNDTVTTTLAVGNNPCAIAITPSGAKAYIANRNSMSVSVIEVANNSLITTVTVGIFPDAIVISPDGQNAYVVNNNSGTVSVISTSSDSVTATLSVGSNPCAAAISGTKVFVLNNSSANVSVIDTTNNTVSTINVGLSPEAIAIPPDQAPLAKFTVSSAKSPTVFDASASASPVGAIATYFWDFGDGTTLTTSSPIATHSYAVSGTYTVTLTVTNTAGTSITQVFSPISSNDLSFNAAAFLLNGAASAVVTQTVDVEGTLLPPTNLSATKVTNKFLNFTNLAIVLTWDLPSTGTIPSCFKIYRDAGLTKLAGTVSRCKQLKFVDPNRKKGRTYTYFVVSVDQFGNQSAAVEIVVKEKS